MNIVEIIWLDRFVQKIEQKHAVEVAEVEQLFANQPRVQFAERGTVLGEDLYSARRQANPGATWWYSFSTSAGAARW